MIPVAVLNEALYTCLFILSLNNDTQSYSHFNLDPALDELTNEFSSLISLILPEKSNMKKESRFSLKLQ